MTGLYSECLFTCLPLRKIYAYHGNNDGFDSQAWTNRSKARSILDNAMREAVSNPDKNSIRNYVGQLYGLLPRTEKEGRDDILGV